MSHCSIFSRNSRLIPVWFVVSLAAFGCSDVLDTTSSGNQEPTLEIPTLEAAQGDMVPRFDWQAKDFYRMPWPSDARLSADGRVDLSDLPFANDFFVATYIDALKAVRGYSTMPVIYIPLVEDAGLSAAALPRPAQTLKPESGVQLIELSEDGCGTRTPLEVVYDADGEKYTAARTLKAAPMPGWVLRPATPYALIVTRSFGGAGLTMARPQAFSEHFNGSGANPRLNDSFAPLRRCLAHMAFDAEDIALATVFHTQDPVLETRLMRQVVWDTSTQVQPPTQWQRVDGASNATQTVYLGRAPFPIFQKGVAPYLEEGGLEFDADGIPLIQRWESVPFMVSVPTTPRGPLNLLIWEDGTGAELGGTLNDRHWVGALNEGFAIATFVPQFHKHRGERDFDPVMDSFNYLNPVSGRTVFRQQAVETSYFIRLLEEQIVKKAELPQINTERIFYGGHSQGSLVGSLVAGIEPRIDTYMFSGVAAYLTETVLSRKDPFDIAELLKGLLGTKRDIDRFHPMVQMAQTGADAVDTQNYAPFWRGWAEHPGGSNIFIINGQHDDTTSVLGMNALLCAGDVPPAGTPGWNVDPTGLRTVENAALPVRHNQTSYDGSPRTVGAYLHPDTGHFTLYRRQEASRAAVNFWATSANGAAVIEY